VCIGTTWGDVLESAKDSAHDAKEASAPTFKAVGDTASSAAESAKEVTAPAVDAATPAVQTIGEKTESFAQWAYGKISGGLGLSSEEEKPQSK